MEFLFQIDGKIPNLNSIIRSRAAHWAIYAKEKNQWKETISLLLKGANTSLLSEGPLSFHFVWGIRRNADIDNCTPKFIFDTLVECGYIPGDNFEFVRMVTHEAVLSKESFVKIFVEKYLPSSESSVK